MAQHHQNGLLLDLSEKRSGVARCVAEALKGWNESTFGNVYQKV